MSGPSDGLYYGAMRRLLYLLISLVILTVMAFFALNLFRLWRDFNDPRSQDFLLWWQGDKQEQESLITVQRETCPGAPFILPADGYIGLLYGDPRGPYSTASPHQGIDIFSNTEPGLTPVYAAYDGYLTREPDWRSTIIMRVPDDPLHPGNQVWLYYTHMADRGGNDFIVDEFPPGTREKFVPQGTLLGYTGDYNGNSLRDVWVHLHFSIVKDNSSGQYLNELQFENTLDPAPYLGLPVNYACPGANTSAMECVQDLSCS